MADIQEFIKQLQDTSLSFEEQKQALQMIEESLLQAKEEEQQAIEDDTTLIVDAVKVIESNLNNKFDKLANSPKLVGKDGSRGADGKNGKDGLNGRDGKDGKDGEDGLDGQDGAYITEVEIALDDTLLITLSDGTQIKTSKEITGPKGDVGPQGPKGAKGDTGNRGVPGAGIATGGTTGQVLTKASNNDYDTTWTTNGSGTVTSITAGTGLSGGTITSSGTIAIDSTVATLTGSQTLTNKTLTSPTVNTPVISGGTIDNTVIGGTTPAAGTFTTITGQTEVLKGTGQNLLVRSQEFDNASWGKTFVTVTANSTTAPDGSSTADTLAATSADSACFQSVTTSNVGLTYTFSVYLKADVATNISIAFYDIPTYNVTLAACAVTTSWQRFTVTRTLASGATSIQATIGGNSTFSTGETVYAWAAQVELGSTANTYIPTTTTAVYGTPTLSFSGVAGIGLESNGALYVSPAGTGAIQAQATTSSATGGNARGANAVDWQTSRTTAAQVASGGSTVIGGGVNNTSSGAGTFVGGGLQNQSTSQYSVTVGGYVNQSTQQYSAVLGGQANLATGFFNVITGGYANSGTANAAVTTQSGTMNATTAVTLSGSNANIKVGQYIVGTSIANNTYVAAISGTALTLSQAASGSSTSTLSFFTPHGVVVGGGNNQATGSYSFIGGGGDAGTAANRNAASGDWSTVCGGIKNVASGLGSFVGGGGTAGGSPLSNLASGTLSIVVGGWNNQSTASWASIVGGQSNAAIANFASVGGGQSNYASGTNSTISGGTFGTTRGIAGYQAFPAHNSPVSSAIYGASQGALLILGRQTTDATATVLTSDVNAASTTNQVILPNNSAYYFKGSVIAGVTGAGDTKGWSIEGVIKRGAGVGTTAIVGTATVVSTYADAGAATWAVTALADTTNGGLKITVTGAAATTIRWVAKVETTEMTY